MTDGEPTRPSAITCEPPGDTPKRPTALSACPYAASAESFFVYERCGSYNARTDWRQIRRYTATTISSTPLSASTSGADVRLARYPLNRLPSGEPPRKAIM